MPGGGSPRRPRTACRSTSPPNTRAVDGERDQRFRFEVVDEEAHREDRRHGGDYAADERLAADPVAEVAEQVGQLDDARGEDDRRGEQEGEARRVAVVQAAASPAPIVTPSRLMPASRAVDWAAPITNASRYSSVVRAPAPLGLRRPREPPVRAPAARRRKRSAREQQQPVDHQEDRRQFRLRGERAQLVLEREADDARRDARDDDQPRQPLVARLGAARAQRVEERADDFHPVAPVVDQQAERAADVQHHDERQPEGLRFGLRMRRGCSSRTGSGTAPCGRGSRSGTARSRPAGSRARSPGSR